MGQNRVTRGGALIGNVVLPTGAKIAAVKVTITNAELLAIRATPKTLVAAPGAGKRLLLLAASIKLTLVAAYTETIDNLAVRFVDGSGVQASQTVESTGLIDQTGTLYSNIEPKIDTIATAAQCVNVPLVLHNTGDGEFGGGNAGNSAELQILYAVVPA